MVAARRHIGYPLCVLCAALVVNRWLFSDRAFRLDR
jgi:hypothetical protein